MSEERVPLHPAVADLLQHIVVKDSGYAGFPAPALVACRRRLLTELRDDHEAFLHVLVAWSRYHDNQLEPASDQLYELVLLFPQMQNAKSKEEVLCKARAAARMAGKDAIQRVASGLPTPRGGGTGIKRWRSSN